MRLVAFGALAWLGLSGTAARASHVAIGVNLGCPVCYRPWGCYHPCGFSFYYRPYPIYVEGAPVVVQPAPVVVQPVPVAQATVAAPPATAQAAPAGQPVYRAVAPDGAVQTTAYNGQQPDIDHNLQLLSDANDQVRGDAVMGLGRLKAARAVEPLTATLAGDRSPAVRDAAARALGLIGDTRALTALKYAAQADADRDVRHSAQFAVEVIQSNMKR
jgi:hypothetical protein